MKMKASVKVFLDLDSRQHMESAPPPVLPPQRRIYHAREKHLGTRRTPVLSRDPSVRDTLRVGMVRTSRPCEKATMRRAPVSPVTQNRNARRRAPSACGSQPSEKPTL